MIQIGREQDDKRDTVYARLSSALRRRLAERSSRSNTIITMQCYCTHRASTVRYHRDMQAQDPDDHRRTRKLVGGGALREARQPHHEQRKCIPLRHLRAALMDKHNVDVSAQTVPRDLEAVGAASRKREKQPVLVAKPHRKASCVRT
jgi:hypothetical protein